MTDMNTDFICDHFLNYVFAKKADARHVRRVTAWIGLLVLAIDRRRLQWNLRYKTQLGYTGRDGQQFVVRYNHKLTRGERRVGGIEILDRNSYQSLHQFTSLADVEAFYRESLELAQAA